METMIAWSNFKTPHGDLLLVANPTELIGLYFEECAHVPEDRKDWVLDEEHPILMKATTQLQEYFDGKRTVFSIPLGFAGTEFQEKVWQSISRIPFGQTISYGELATNAGNPQALRAVGDGDGE